MYIERHALKKTDESKNESSRDGSEANDGHFGYALSKTLFLYDDHFPLPNSRQGSSISSVPLLGATQCFSHFHLPHTRGGKVSWD